MKLQNTKSEESNRKLNWACFLLPIILTLPAFFIDGTLGLSGLIMSCVSAFLSGYILLFWPSRKVKQAAWSHLFGFAVAVGIFILGAYINLSGQSSPWLQ